MLRGRVVDPRISLAPVAGAIVDGRRTHVSLRRTRTAADGTFAARLTVLVRPNRRVIGISASIPGDAVRAWPVRITRPA